MPEYLAPGVYVEESTQAGRSISGAATSIAAFVGRAARGPVDCCVHLRSFADYTRTFGGLWQPGTMSAAVDLFFRNGGADALVVRAFGGERAPPLDGDADAGRDVGDDGGPITDADLIGDRNARTGLFALENADRFNLLCLPPPDPDADVGTAAWATAAAYCRERRAVVLIDAPAAAARGESTGATRGRASAPPPGAEIAAAAAWVETVRAAIGESCANAAAWFPRLRVRHPLDVEELVDVAPAGAIAGIIARTDVSEGVWRSPSGPAALVAGAERLSVSLSDAEQSRLNPIGLNCLRSLPGIGSVVWGARTLAGADHLASEWKYLAVRRLALHIEESIERGAAWTAFEPNGEPTWARIRQAVDRFMRGLFRQGALQGTTAAEAYHVACGRQTTTQDDLDSGSVTVEVGFAPVKPAEFVVLSIRLRAAQSQR